MRFQGLVVGVVGSARAKRKKEEDDRPLVNLEPVTAAEPRKKNPEKLERDLAQRLVT